MGTSRERTKQRWELRNEYFETLKETASFVNPYVENFIETHFQLFPELKSLLLGRYRSGKTQLRSSSVRFSYETVGGKDWQKIVPACAAVTLRETGYYCLDDYFDSDAKPEDLPLFGFPFFSISYGIISELGNSFSAEQVKGVLRELYMLDELCGQGFFVEQEGMDNETQYMKKVYGYNFWEQALRIGGILGNGSSEDVEKLGEIGKNIGMAIIIANDTWDFAKGLEDFRLGKRTLPIMWAMQNVESRDRDTLESLIGQKHLSEEEIDEVRRIMVRNSVIEYGKERANGLCSVALALLSSFPDSKARSMIEFSTTMTQKNKYYKFLKGYAPK
ncbi:MAG: polyprenyl synthetase family protein [Nanoarchaeota archaeon]|nr:polyprenyl synthetase family protein [Nanoarchaeota archaeon]